MYQEIANIYQQSNVFTSNPAKLVIMCYEGAISSLKLARNAYIEKDYETKGMALKKVIDIIHELNASLDMSKGGEVAANLRALYLYIIRILIEADLKSNLDAFDRSICILEELASAWKAIAATNESAVDAKPRSTRIPSYGAASSAVSAQAWSA